MDKRNREEKDYEKKDVVKHLLLVALFSVVVVVKSLSVDTNYMSPSFVFDIQFLAIGTGLLFVLVGWLDYIRTGNLLLIITGYLFFGYVVEFFNNNNFINTINAIQAIFN